MLVDKPLEKEEYVLVIKVPIKALDNLQARQIANGYLKCAAVPEGAAVKLQRLQEGKQPQGVPL